MHFTTKQTKRAAGRRLAAQQAHRPQSSMCTHHIKRSSYVRRDDWAIRPAVHEMHTDVARQAAAGQQQWCLTRNTLQEMQLMQSSTATSHYCTMRLRCHAAAHAQPAPDKHKRVSWAAVSRRPASLLPQLLALLSFLALGTAAASSHVNTSSLTLMLPSVRVSASRVLQATPASPQQVAYDPALPPGTPQRDALWLSHMPHEGALSTVRNITLVSGNGSAVSAASPGVPDVRSVNASVAAAGCAPGGRQPGGTAGV